MYVWVYVGRARQCVSGVSGAAVSLHIIPPLALCPIVTGRRCDYLYSHVYVALVLTSYKHSYMNRYVSYITMDINCEEPAVHKPFT